jgi:hypothetical protein
MIELTEEQARLVEQQQDPLRVVNPRTREVFVLIRQEVYARAREPLGGGEGESNGDHPLTAMGRLPGMSEGIWLALATLRRDLPELLASRATRGKYVCYRRDKRVAVGRDYRSVMAEVVRLDIPEHEYVVQKVVPGAGSVEEEEIDARVELDEEPA